MYLTYMNEHAHVQDCFGDPARFALHTDGEALVMDQAFNEVVLALFKQYLIDYGKGAPALSLLHQECDDGRLFDSTHKELTNVVKNGTNVRDSFLAEQIIACVWDKLHAEFPSLNVSAAYKEKLSYGLQCVVYATSKSWNSRKVKESFVETGWHRYDTKEGEETIDFDRILARSLDTSVTEEQLQHMTNARFSIAEEFQLKGRTCTCYFL